MNDTAVEWLKGSRCARKRGSVWYSHKILQGIPLRDQRVAASVQFMGDHHYSYRIVNLTNLSTMKMLFCQCSWKNNGFHEN